jgi:hypothetical protein
MNEGVKYDQNKVRFDLLPAEFLFGTSEVLTYGAAKYGVRNWEKGMSWGRVFAALMRHMWAWWRGEKLDPETKMPHLWHASCCLAFLIAYEARGVGTDDRNFIPDDKQNFAPRRATYDPALSRILPERMYPQYKDDPDAVLVGESNLQKAMRAVEAAIIPEDKENHHE